MKRIISFAICIMMILAVVPASSIAGGTKPDLPFALSAPENVVAASIESGDSRISISFTQPDDLIAFFREKDDAYLAESDEPGSVERFYAKYGIEDVWVGIQGDWAIDDVNDSVSGWHYSPVWDNDGLNEDYQKVVGPWDMFDVLWAAETTVNSWQIGGVYYDPAEEPGVNADWLGNPDIPGSVGLKDQVREGQIKFDEEHWGGVDYENHTMYIRMRYALHVTVDGETKLYFSDWSSVGACGKDAPKWKPFTKDSLAAPSISNLEMTMGEFNDYPIVKFDLAVPDELAAAIAEVEARGGALWLETEGRVPGKTEWVQLQGDFVVRPGRVEMTLVHLVDPEEEAETGKVEININTPLEIRCRYYCSQYESYGGEWLGDFCSEYSKVLKLAGQETYKGSGDVNSDGKINARDVIIIMKAILPGFVAPKGYAEKEADVNGDAKINGRDVIAVMKLVVAQG